MVAGRPMIRLGLIDPADLTTNAEAHDPVEHASAGRLATRREPHPGRTRIACRAGPRGSPEAPRPPPIVGGGDSSSPDRGEFSANE